MLKLKLTVKDPKYIADIQKKTGSNTELSLKNTSCLNKYNLDQRHRTAYLLKMVQTSLCRYLSSYDTFCSYWTLYENYPGTLPTSIKSPNISGRCHFPILFLNRWVNREIQCLVQRFSLNQHGIIPPLLLTSLWHVFHVSYSAIILQIFSELSVFPILKCHMSV